MKKQNTIGKVITGVAIGAAAGAAAVALSDKKNRKKLAGAVEDLNNKAQNMVKDIRSDKNIQKLEKKAKPIAEKARKEAAKAQ